MHTLRLLNLRRLRRQPLRAVIALVSVAAGVALVAAVPVVSGSTKRSIERFGRALAGPAPLRVIGPVGRAGLDASVLPKIEVVDGVGAAVPLVQAVTYAEINAGKTPQGFPRLRQVTVLAFGVDCRVEALLGKFGCDQAALDQQPPTAPPLLSSSLAAAARSGGDRVVLRTDNGDIPLTGAPSLRQLDRLNGGRIAVLPLPVAQARFGRENAYDVVYVQPKPGVPIAALQRRLQAAVGGWNRVLVATDPPPATALYGNLLLPLFFLVGLFALGIGAVLIRNTVALSVEERRRDIAIASAVGASSRVVRGGIMVEAAILGLLGGLLGALGGLGVAHPIAAAVSGFTERLGGLRVTVSASTYPFVFGAVVGIIISLIAAWRPARLATRIDVAAELANRDLRDESAPALSVRRGVIYTVAGLAGIAIVYMAQRHGGIESWAPIASQVGLLLSILFIILAIGSFAPVVVHATRGWSRRGSAPLRLAWGNLGREPGRTRVMAVAVASAVGIALTLGTLTQSIRISITDSIFKNFGNQVQVSSLDPNNTLNIDAKLAPDALSALAQIPGVSRVNRAAFALVGTTTNQLMGVEGNDHAAFSFSIIKGKAERAAFERGEVLVGPALARLHHLRPGGPLRVPGRTGFVDLTVQGIWQDGDFNGTKITMPLWLLEQTWGPQPIGVVNVTPVSGLRAETLRSRIVAAHLAPFLRAETVRPLVHRITSSIGQQLSPFWAMQRALVLVSFLAVLFTLLLVAVQRRREFGLLAAVGMRPSELGAMVVLEAVIVGVAGVLLGLVGSFAFSEAFRQAAVIIVGFRDPWTVGWSAFLVWGPIVVLVVALAAVFPGWRTSRIEVVEALRYE